MSASMLSKVQRLNTAGVATVMSHGRAVQSGSFLLKYIKKGPTGATQAAFVAPKKVFKTAVLRNKAKRRGRAILSRLCQEYSLQKGFLLVFLFRPAVTEGEFARLLAETEQVLLKNDILQA